MTHSHFRLTLATAVALVLAVPSAASCANEGVTAQVAPGSSLRIGEPRARMQVSPRPLPSGAIPTQEEARAALMTPISSQPSLGDSAADQAAQQALSQPVAAGGTTGVGAGQSGSQTAAANSEPPPSGPIGAIGQTLPAKFSIRNDILDRVPIMAFPFGLSDQELQKIYAAVMADKSPVEASAESLMPTSMLTTDQALNGMHPLPGSLRDISQIQRLKYVKAKDKVLLVEPATRVVVDEIKS